VIEMATPGVVKFRVHLAAKDGYVASNSVTRRVRII
jgi:hypothetical protein